MQAKFTGMDMYMQIEKSFFAASMWFACVLGSGLQATDYPYQTTDEKIHKLTSR